MLNREPRHLTAPSVKRSQLCWRDPRRGWFVTSREIDAILAAGTGGGSDGGAPARLIEVPGADWGNGPPSGPRRNESAEKQAERGYRGFRARSLLGSGLPHLPRRLGSNFYAIKRVPRDKCSDAVVRRLLGRDAPWTGRAGQCV